MSQLASFYGGDHKGSVFGYSSEYGHKYHYGQDISGHVQGTPIPALAAGRVARAGWQSSHGWWLAVDTGDGWYDTYSHMVSLWHDVDAWIAVGGTVGPLGSTGESSGPHLHKQRTRNPFPWSHGTEVDPWPRIVNLLTSSAGSGITPFESEEDNMASGIVFINTDVSQNGKWLFALAGSGEGAAAWHRIHEYETARKMVDACHGVDRVSGTKDAIPLTNSEFETYEKRYLGA